MGKLTLVSFGLLPYDGKGPTDWKNFIEDVDICINEAGMAGSVLFRLRIVSIAWLLNQINDETKWISLKYCLVMKYYDEKVIEEHIKKIIQECNKKKSANSFDYLSHHFEYESEEWLY